MNFIQRKAKLCKMSTRAKALHEEKPTQKKMNEFHSEKSKFVQNKQITHLLTVKAIDCVKESLKWMNRRAKANTRAEANMRAKANARAGTRNVAVGARENLTPLGCRQWEHTPL